jgi:flagellar biosynthesis protein FliQ
MAASLPVVLVLTDYFKERQINVKTILEKIPFFLLALILGVVAVLVQGASQAIQDLPLSWPQRIVYACYAFITYLFKLVLPLNLSAYYPYPERNGNDIPIQYYVYVLFSALAFLRSLFFSYYSYCRLEAPSWPTAIATFLLLEFFI